MSTSQQKPIMKCDRTPLAQFARVLDRATDKEKAFLEELLHEWNENNSPVQEAALSLGATACGVHWLCSPEDENFIQQHGADMLQFYLMFSLGEEWLTGMLSLLAHQYREGRLRMPEDALGAVEMAMTDFRNAVEQAQEVIKTNPELLADEMREAVRKLEGAK